MKHKVGDKVKIRSLEWYNENKNKWGNVTIKDKNFSLGMLEYCGKEAIIEQVFSCCYNIDIDNERHYWTDEMFEEQLNVKTMEQKKTFEPFERVIYRTQDGFWNCGLYSHEDSEHHYLCGAIIVWKEHDFIMPFAGNETLVGTREIPCEEIVLKEGEMVVAFSSKDAILYMDFSLCSFWEIQDDAIKTSIGSLYNYCIPLSKFDQNDLEETKKHILCVKNGKLVRATNV